MSAPVSIGTVHEAWAWLKRLRKLRDEALALEIKIAAATAKESDRLAAVLAQLGELRAAGTAPFRLFCIAQSGAETTWKSPYGSGVFRGVGATVAVEDEEAAIAYALVHLPETVLTKTVLDKAPFNSAAKQLYNATGFETPGVRFTPKHNKFEVEL